MAGLDSVGQHPLSLKVMRVSRPSLASHWQPFFSSSPSFSAHSTAHPLSLQGAEPLPGHPKTLRDLTHASNLLTLPAAFGAIQLGETFACVLSVNNEVGLPVDSVRARVEMQTATSKVLLAEVNAGDSDRDVKMEETSGSGTGTLGTGDSLELCVATEIKELGQHVLACTVTYRTPPGMRPATSGAYNAEDPFMQTFRKFYKFMVTNPLSVKSKVHVPKSPTALLSRSERDKVFLEVHIQNLTQAPMWFEKIRLEAVEGWDVVDANAISPPFDLSSTADAENEKSIFSGSMALMPPHDMRQYVYILTPKFTPRNTSVPAPPVPGTVIPLGRLDISWRSSMGEPGRLLTSILSRRIPLPAPPSSGAAPASTLPPYLQKAVMPHSPRPRSPSLQQQAQQQQQRTGTPPPLQRPGSPMKRSTTPGAPARPQSPSTAVPPVPSLPSQPSQQADIAVDLVLLERPEDATVRVEEPFSLRFSLAISALQPLSTPSLLGEESSARKQRVITLAVQHTFPAPPPVPEQTNAVVPTPGMLRTLKKRNSTTLSFDTVGSGMHSPSSHAGSIDVLTPRRVVSPPPGSAVSTNAPVPIAAGGERESSMVTSPTATAARGVGSVTVGGLTERLRRVALSEALGLGLQDADDRGDAFGDTDELGGTMDVKLPSPYSTSLKSDNNHATTKSGRVQFSGTSVVFLPPISLLPPPSPSIDLQSSSSTISPYSPSSSNLTIRPERGEGSVEFVLSYIPRVRGFAQVGGLRVLLIKDEEKAGEEDGEDEVTLHTQGEVVANEAQILREWDTVAEVWCLGVKMTTAST
ncbi:DUF974-domain-containing protein [Fomitiporia mediterranea MF3/22]|uniref:DUF974-domain-containing protein n=1 Tax=Fomitiporia mediterranea (strain MF3/22) TaxID=694068 RepID=UPI00044080FE|nr:DUF974-domain-containing protein [Fomitiporia mediterranea MF3/22]EJD02114.1 DUF974-domain-containing protein [Fomitiporia mediterranea MF3/22]